MKPTRGFSLIEVIIIIMLMAVMAAMFASYLGRPFTQSAASSGLVSNQYKLIQEMELITIAYRQALPIANLCAFKTSFVDGRTYVDAANTTCTFRLTSGTFTTRPALLVTLTDGQQTVQSIFTN